MNNIFITFIIPTIGRDSLKNSVQSLLNQTDNNWNAIIIFDGIKNNLLLTDIRIKIIEINKIGIQNNAGLVRNIGIKNVENSEWIGFLDDDDYISNDYITNLKNEISLNIFDICIFRMAYNNKLVLPTKNDKNIIRNKVGISFAVKKYITITNLFINNPFEDFLYLKQLQNQKYKIIISSYISYFVRTPPYIINELYPKILL